VKIIIFRKKAGRLNKVIETLIVNRLIKTETVKKQLTNNKNKFKTKSINGEEIE
jgi:hypothetical protein